MTPTKQQALDALETCEDVCVPYAPHSASILRAYIEQAEPAGFVRVPVEPTLAMKSVLLEMLTNCHSVEESYSDLIAAAPKEPT
jgi:hypothetical protein